MGGEAGAARALFERYLKARLKDPELEFETWLEGHAQMAESLRSLYSEQSTGLFRSPREAAGGDASYEAGEELGDFRLIEFLGAGGMGEVWKAEQLSVARPVALKLIRRDKQLTPRALQRFEREAQAGARITHPNIASVYTVGRSADRPYIAQELIEGGSPLSSFLDEMRGEKLPSDYFPKVAELFATVLDALQAAHAAGVIHRDLKPQNILVTAEDQPVIVDFGLARIEDADPLSRTGDLVGTYFYMSPEQAMSRRMGIDHRTDVFSAGATLYELLTFRRAFDGETTHEVAEKILYTDPPEPRTIEHRVPRDLAVICTKALEKRRQDRYQSASEFADDLRRYLADEPIHARPATAAQKAARWLRRHPALSGTSLVLLVAAFVVVTTLRASTGARTIAERDKLYARAQYALEVNDLEGARGLVEEAVTLDPGDPTGHLILALGYAKFGRLAELEAEVGSAVDKGFSTDGTNLETGIDHLAYSLYLRSFRDHSRYPEAERHLERALELDPYLSSAHFMLYQLHYGLGQRERALADLEAFQERLATGNPFWTVVEGLEAELRGDYARACSVLEDLAAREDLDPQRRRELRLDRNLGRNYLQAGDFDSAEVYLRRAIEEPRDCSSMEHLAMLCFQRVLIGQDEVRWLEEMGAVSARAIACSASMGDATMLAAYAAVELFGKEELKGAPRERDSWRAADAALERFGEAFPEDPDLGRLRARLLYLEAMCAIAARDRRAAADLLRAALEQNPESLRSRAMLGQCHWWLAQYEQGLDQLERALALWDRSPRDDEWRPKWMGVILTWAYGNAISAGDAEAAGRLRLRIVEELEIPAFFELTELLSLAEFLAAEERPELRDCVLALDVVERFALRTAFLGGPHASEAAGILETIDRSCP